MTAVVESLQTGVDFLHFSNTGSQCMHLMKFPASLMYMYVSRSFLSCWFLRKRQFLFRRWQAMQAISNCTLLLSLHHSLPWFPLHIATGTDRLSELLIPRRIQNTFTRSEVKVLRRKLNDSRCSFAHIPLSWRSPPGNAAAPYEQHSVIYYFNCLCRLCVYL